MVNGNKEQRGKLMDTHKISLNTNFPALGGARGQKEIAFASSMVLDFLTGKLTSESKGCNLNSNQEQ